MQGTWVKAEAPDATTALRHAITQVPVPGAPPPSALDEAEVGLSFLDLALEQNHVRRITERLALVEHLAPECTTEIDVSLGLLDQEQRIACESFQQLRQRNPAKSRDEQGLWVPVARLPRQFSFPIDVRDYDGSRVPRLAQLELAGPVAAGLYQLLRNALGSHPDAKLTDSDLADFLYTTGEPRWLVQSALTMLISSRSQATPPNTGASTNSHGHRHTALRILAGYEDTLRQFFHLLGVALNEYLLVVNLDEGRDNHLLSYDVPLLRKPVRGRPLNARGVYVVRYQTEVPSSLRSYHLVAATEQSLQISDMYLTSMAGTDDVDRIQRDLGYLATLVDPAGGQNVVPRSMVEHELETTVGALAELTRRRRWEAAEAGIPWPIESLRATETLAAAWHTRSGPFLDNARVVADRLRRAATEITTQQLGSDYFQTDVVSASRNHAYWRRLEEPVATTERTQIEVGILVQDATRSGPRALLAYAGTVLVLSYATIALLAGEFWWPFRDRPGLRGGIERDALVAVLLLVPGFLYTRLQLPPRHSIAARVRERSRYLAYATIAVAIAEALTIAAVTSDDTLVVVFSIGVACLAVLVVLSIVVDLPRRELRLTTPTVPTWARRQGWGSTYTPDVEFAALGVMRNHGFEGSTGSGARDSAARLRLSLRRARRSGQLPGAPSA
ncbi:hypothetical protein [Jiangella muralis]|uniref:hypothetical protein n=1 Tax=Jiangella muralis TaxID=702383 RepID=UPI0012FCB9EC|nr:hypothetical protein [Jiangella muralis]